MKNCQYCNKPTLFMNNQKKPVCENEYVCEDVQAPTIEEELGDDPTGRKWASN